MALVVVSIIDRCVFFVFYNFFKRGNIMNKNDIETKIIEIKKKIAALGSSYEDQYDAFLLKKQLKSLQEMKKGMR